MNYLWGGMILIGIIYGAFTGNMQAVADAAITSSREAVTLCISMTGVLALWCGLMKIGENAGLIASLTHAFHPVITYLFPHIPADHPSRNHICANMIANLLGLGWAATPAGLKAMESLADLEEERRHSSHLEQNFSNNQSAGKLPPAAEKSSTHSHSEFQTAKRKLMPEGTASNEMCTFLIMNISSLQLIPVNIIAYRSQYGSINPTAIVGPAILATAASTLAAVIFCKLMACINGTWQNSDE